MSALGVCRCIHSLLSLCRALPPCRSGHLKRRSRELAVREAEAARAADEDKLTGLPNHAKTLELLDLALGGAA